MTTAATLAPSAPNKTEQWAAATAWKLTAEQWSWVREHAACVDPEERRVIAIAPKVVRITGIQAKALLVHAPAPAAEIAAALTPAQRRFSFATQRRHNDCTSNLVATMKALERKGLGRALRMGFGSGRPDYTWHPSPIAVDVAVLL